MGEGGFIIHMTSVAVVYECITGYTLVVNDPFIHFGSIISI